MALPGELVVTDDVPAAFTGRVLDAFRARPLDTFSLALSGGATARSCYEHLAEHAGNQVDWWKVDVYWGDERCVPHDHVDSNYYLAREALLDHVGAANATVIESECASGHAAGAPYDAILICGAVPQVPRALLDQLKDGGRLVAVVADGSFGRVTQWRRLGGTFDSRVICEAGAPKVAGFEKAKEFVF